MNDEIKEILDSKVSYVFTYKDRNELLNYITNLQQENERLRNHIQMIPYLQTVREKDNYKSRCEKAVEYIKINFVEDIITVKTLLNILNGKE